MKIYVLIEENSKGALAHTFFDNYLDALHSAECFSWGNSYHIEEHEIGDHTLTKTELWIPHKSGPVTTAKVIKPKEGK